MIGSLVLKIRRRETPKYRLIYSMIKCIMNWSFPCIKPFHKSLYYIVTVGSELYHRTIEKLFVVPMFKSRLTGYGKNLTVSSLPYIEGDNLKIVVGDNVSFHGGHALSGFSVYRYPVLRVGSNTGIGYGTSISVALSVEIGDNCMIAPFVYIADNNGHPINSERRHEKLIPSDIAPVKIGNNVWICRGATILKGSIIGDNSVVGAGCVVSGIIPPNTIVSRPRCVMSNVNLFS